MYKILQREKSVTALPVKSPYDGSWVGFDGLIGEVVVVVTVVAAVSGTRFCRCD